MTVSTQSLSLPTNYKVLLDALQERIRERSRELLAA